VGIGRMKFWHWLLIGLIIGPALGLLHSGEPPDEDGQLVRTISQVQFEGMMRRSPRRGLPAARKVVIYPPDGGHQTVTGESLESIGINSGDYVPFVFLASVPFRTASPKLAERMPPGASVREYLDAVQTLNPSLSFHFAWWRVAGAQFAIWTIGGFLGLGVVCPVLLGVLSGSRRERMESLFDPKGSIPQMEQAQPSGLGPQDQERLAALEAELMENLSAAGSPDGAQTSKAAAETWRILPSKPLEAPPLPGEPPKVYAGEFYPVAASAPKDKPDFTEH